MFLGEDLLAQRWVVYAYLYPFAEALAGALMVADALVWLSGPDRILYRRRRVWVCLPSGLHRET